MCGIVGYVNSKPAPDGFIERACRTLYHRGPDASNSWFDQARRVAFGHTRLAIQDTTEAGAQPMVSNSKRFVLTFNGEIYNHLRLRESLKGYPFKGGSDTETLIACIEEFGVTATLKRAVGMFAFGLWDLEERVLYLARDRIGEKPLYYLSTPGGLVFGSEPQVFKHLPEWQPEVDRDALGMLLKYSYIPVTHSIYKGVSKLPQGSLLTYELSTGQLQVVPYWDLAQAAAQGSQNRLAPDEVMGQLERQLEQSVGDQMLSDVPLGAFLSGGIDSSVVVMMMQRLSRRPVRTFTIGFAEESHNEARYAREVARLLGTEHTEITLSGQDALEVVPKLPQLYAEPFADSSQIPTHLVSCFARKSVTVALSGDGGDELFGGYNRYTASEPIFNMGNQLPRWARTRLAALILSVPSRLIENIERMLSQVEHLKVPQLSNLPDKIYKVAIILQQDNFHGVYKHLVSQWHNPARVVHGCEADALDQAFAELGNELQPAERMMLLDVLTYLPDDLLCKVDRASMGVSLETRAPFLDHRLVELSLRIPLSMKIRDGQGKWPLRQLLYRELPVELVDRPKMGFSIPLADWLRGPLKSWAEELLNEDRLRAEGYFNPEPIRMKWHQHQRGHHNWHNHLWSVLMFQSWLEIQPHHIN